MKGRFNSAAEAAQHIINEKRAIENLGYKARDLRVEKMKNEVYISTERGNVRVDVKNESTMEAIRALLMADVDGQIKARERSLIAAAQNMPILVHDYEKEEQE